MGVHGKPLFRATSKPTCLEVFSHALAHPEDTEFGKNVQQGAEAGAALLAAGSRFAADLQYNAALQRMTFLAGQAAVGGWVSVPFRSSIVRGLLSNAQRLLSNSEFVETGGGGAAIAFDALAANALYEEYKAIRNGTCTPEIHDPNK